MSYIVISPEGELTHHVEEPTLDQINAAVGEPGYAGVRLHGTPEAHAFVNDCGHVMDPPLPRNPIGACLIWCLGATTQAYAGPVVITGWDDLLGDTRPLSEPMLAAVTAMWGAITRDLASDEPSADLAGYAAWVRTSPAPLPIVLSGYDALAHLRRDLGPQ